MSTPSHQSDKSHEIPSSMGSLAAQLQQKFSDNSTNTGIVQKIRDNDPLSDESILRVIKNNRRKFSQFAGVILPVTAPPEEGIETSTEIMAMGLDSLGLIDLALEIEQKTGIETEQILPHLNSPDSTVCTLTALLREKLHTTEEHGTQS